MADTRGRRVRTGGSSLHIGAKPTHAGAGFPESRDEILDLMGLTLEEARRFVPEPFWQTGSSARDPG
jgi:hypothetical protein